METSYMVWSLGKWDKSKRTAVFSRETVPNYHHQYPTCFHQGAMFSSLGGSRAFRGRSSRVLPSPSGRCAWKDHNLTNIPNIPIIQNDPKYSMIRGANWGICKGRFQKRFSGIRPLRGGGYPPIPLRKKTFFFSDWFSVKAGGGGPP